MVCPDALTEKLSADVSFVGSLYNEDHNFFDRLETISDFTRGYLDAIMHAQQNVYGSFFLEDLLTPDIIADLQKAAPYTPMSDGTESAAYVYANYFPMHSLWDLWTGIPQCHLSSDIAVST